MSKDFKVLWTENSIADLLAIKEYISEDPLDRAEAWILELFNLGDSPNQSMERTKKAP